MDGIRALPVPSCISVSGCGPYGSTYSYRWSALPDPVLRFALEAGEALLRVPTGNSMKFFSDMLQPPLTSSVLHKCFALIRTGIARLSGDSRTALHAPVKTEHLDDGVPLHFDLFLTERLWLVFDEVADDKSGKSLFLPRRLFEAAVKDNQLIPSVTRRRLQTLLRDKPCRDSFDECYDAIHSAANPWTPLLAQAIKRQSWAIKLHRGEGYLVNDRQWLHGRTAVKGRVSSTRFRRLVYGTVG